MARLTIGEMLGLMEMDLDESGLAYFGGRTKGVLWLREAYNNLWASIGKRDPDGQWFGERVVATYTASAESMAITTWSTRGRPHTIIRVGQRATGVSTGGGTKIPFVEGRTVDWLDDHVQYDQVVLYWGGKLWLRPVPTVNTSLVLDFIPPALKLYYDGMGVAAPAGYASWDVYEPVFVDDCYEAIPALAVVLAEQAEKQPSAQHEQRAAMLENQLLRTMLDRVETQDLPGIHVRDLHAFRF